jgi:exodeoxyribonuclease VII small subunit
MTENKSTSFETSLGRLEAIVKELEAEGIELERSVELFKEGRGLVARCEVLLKSAEETLKTADGAAPARAPERADNGSLDDEIPF